MSIINRTPHPLTVVSPDGPPVTIPAAQRHELARVRQNPQQVGTVDDGVPLLSGGWSGIVGLASPQPGVTQVVSVQVVLAAVAAGRSLVDLAIAGDQVRDDSGRIVGCRGLTAASEAWPRPSWQRLPRVAIFGSAARWIGEVSRGGKPRWRPADADVAYVGVDPSAVDELVRDFLGVQAPGLTDLPVDAHCTAGLGRGERLLVPRPGRLVGDDQPLDEALVPVFGAAPDDVALVDMLTLPAIIRRAARLIDAGWSVPTAAEAASATWPTKVDIVVGDAGDATRNDYLASSAAAIARALAKLGPDRAAFLDALGRLGRPVMTLTALASGAIARATLDDLRRGSSARWPTLRIEPGRIGPLYRGPDFETDAAAAAWLRGEG